MRRVAAVWREIVIFAAMKVLLILLGGLSLALGIVGIFLPVLPTTPFLLLTAALWCRGSERLYRWLLAQPQLGSYIRNFREHRAIPRRAKIVTVALVWISLIYCAVAVTKLWWLRALFLLIAAGTTWHILSYRTLEKDAPAE